MIDITTADGTFSAYLATPPSGKGPAIVLLQEIFGVNAVMRELADFYAAQGFFALVPDLFWRLQPGIELTDKTQEEWQAAFGYMQRFDTSLGIQDVQATITHARTLPGVTGKVGAVGYCLGGFLAYLTAVRTDVNASVGYYGMNIDKFLGEAANLKKPLMLHDAGKDEFNPPEKQKLVADFFADNPLVTIHRYPEMGHAFARPGGAHYDDANAILANGRTITFFKQHLG
ncbi:carboxymethylenebutenolidase [Rhizomicrobium palustre]|uniref:Carboxymethylenebutenolidase n=1 Tax=Rhizomicrobium palustre TaxID=189966 RepID=A0A846MXS7_9PROT|nr:dienelactone hydrolase family protein [Rhizomicrobium palustre]NIK88186.1 carboxymethylenebutenolidase [Rhizomicrobium palustre]